MKMKKLFNKTKLILHDILSIIIRDTHPTGFSVNKNSIHDPLITFFDKEKEDKLSIVGWNFLIRTVKLFLIRVIILIPLYFFVGIYGYFILKPLRKLGQRVTNGEFDYPICNLGLHYWTYASLGSRTCKDCGKQEKRKRISMGEERWGTEEELEEEIEYYE